MRVSKYFYPSVRTLTAAASLPHPCTQSNYQIEIGWALELSQLPSHCNLLIRNPWALVVARCLGRESQTPGLPEALPQGP